jgi:hypothetical protein
MFQNNVEENDFFSINVSKSNETVFFHMSLRKINDFIKLLLSFSKKTSIELSKPLLNIGNMEDGITITKVWVKYKSIQNDDLILNAVPEKHILYIFCSEAGIEKLSDYLLALREDLEKNKIEDISLMVPEWGGYGLINKKVVKGSNVIEHLRLYGVLI